MSKLLLTVPALAAMTFAPPAEGQQLQGYRVGIDCYIQNHSNEGTNNPVLIRRVDSDGTQRLVQARAITDDDCDWRDALGTLRMAGGSRGLVDVVVSRVSGTRPTAIRVAISGDDAFFIDWMQLEEADGQGGWRTIATWGVDGGHGYCLSTDPGDAHRSWSDIVSSRGCRPCFEFRVSGQDVVECQSRDGMRE